MLAIERAFNSQLDAILQERQKIRDKDRREKEAAQAPGPVPGELGRRAREEGLGDVTRQEAARRIEAERQRRAEAGEEPLTREERRGVAAAGGAAG